ncbi:Rieske (2Fe-2S) protein [Calidifontibacter indicus]|uniref:Rieske (2Fe-2S) protein n=1 Tax=Calidifontibacter indicus TaxID=419650 RepID=UPI003D72AA1F
MSDQKRPTDRRSVLRGLGVVAAAGGLAACSKDDVDAAKTSASDLGSSASSGASQAAGSASSAASSVSSSVSAEVSGDSIPTAKVPVGSGYIDADKKIVVSQPEAGQFKAFSSICTHKSCPITRIDGDAAVCPCHGSAFSLSDGSVVNGPADKPLSEKKVTVDGANLIVS